MVQEAGALPHSPGASQPESEDILFLRVDGDTEQVEAHPMFDGALAVLALSAEEARSLQRALQKFLRTK